MKPQYISVKLVSEGWTAVLRALFIMQQADILRSDRLAAKSVEREIRKQIKEKEERKKK